MAATRLFSVGLGSHHLYGVEFRDESIGTVFEWIRARKRTFCYRLATPNTPSVEEFSSSYRLRFYRIDQRGPKKTSPFEIMLNFNRPYLRL